MIIFNYGIARSGTVLANAIIRNLLTKRRWPARNINVDNDPKILDRVVKKVTFQEAHRYSNVILHGHIWSSALNDTLAQDRCMRAIVSYRDLRDVTVSLMKLHDLSWEDAGQQAKVMAKNLTPLIQSPHSLSLRYEISVHDRVVLADRIAQHLGLLPQPDELWEISEATSQDKHKAIMESVRDGADGVDVRSIQNRKRVLQEDRRTMINDRHIQSGAQGRWREELPEKDQKLLTEMLEPELKQLGYSIE